MRRLHTDRDVPVENEPENPIQPETRRGRPSRRSRGGRATGTRGRRSGRYASYSSNVPLYEQQDHIRATAANVVNDDNDAMLMSGDEDAIPPHAPLPELEIVDLSDDEDIERLLASHPEFDRRILEERERHASSPPVKQEATERRSIFSRQAMVQDAAEDPDQIDESGTNQMFFPAAPSASQDTSITNVTSATAVTENQQDIDMMPQIKSENTEQVSASLNGATPEDAIMIEDD